MKLSEPVIVARRIVAAKRRAPDRRIAANIRRLQRMRGTRTAGQALAEGSRRTTRALMATELVLDASVSLAWFLKETPERAASHPDQ